MQSKRADQVISFSASEKIMFIDITTELESREPTKIKKEALLTTPG
jgi:hypothetical protein